MKLTQEQADTITKVYVEKLGHPVSEITIARHYRFNHKDTMVVAANLISPRFLAVANNDDCSIAEDYHDEVALTDELEDLVGSEDFLESDVAYELDTMVYVDGKFRGESVRLMLNNQGEIVVALVD